MVKKHCSDGGEIVLKGPMFWIVAYALVFTSMSITFDFFHLFEKSNTHVSGLTRYMLPLMILTIVGTQRFLGRKMNRASRKAKSGLIEDAFDEF